MKKGFTLIEVIIYIALFAFLIGTAFVTTYQLIANSDALKIKNTAQEEGNFVLRKLNWALTGISTITLPSTMIPVSPTLTVSRHDGNTISVRLVNDKIEIKESANENDFAPITTDNTQVSRLDFEYIEPSGGAPAGIMATATINGVDFSINKYIYQ